jgi:hypothetical protein
VLDELLLLGDRVLLRAHPTAAHRH